MGIENFKDAYEKQGHPTINDVAVIETKGPWPSRSGGKLNVPLMLDEEDAVEKFLAYEKTSESKICGLRIYTVTNIPKNGAGDYEFHVYRRKFIMSLQGKVEWECEDLMGSKKTFITDSTTSILLPPFILNKYEAKDDMSSILAMCNTTFEVSDKNTHDTYRQAEFQDLQAYVQKLN